jgi:Putative Flp pilus-assembly TadE/G-like
MLTDRKALGGLTGRRDEDGQAAISLVVILGLFAMGVLGFGVDLSNVWFHKQAARAAADAACQAGAIDILAGASSSGPQKGFTTGTASNCVSTTAATMCSYAAANGYSGAGLTAGVDSNAVSWTFPSSLSGVTANPANTYMTVTVAENVRTYFMSLLTGSAVQPLNVTCSCGVMQVKAAAPMTVLHPTMSASFYYTGGGALYIVGGPQRGLQVNSSSSTAVSWQASAIMDLSKGGPNKTGSDVAIVGGPALMPTNGTSNAYAGGTTGAWKAGVLPVSDPFGTVGVPNSVKLVSPSGGTAGVWVGHGTDNCPDNASPAWVGQDAQGNRLPANCVEFSPGYYPSGLTLPNNYSTVIFKPGIYYLNGSLVAGGSQILRMAKPLGYQQTDGLMFYFFTGSLNFSGCTGCSESSVDDVNTDDLTCDGSPPDSRLGMGSTIGGNVLWAQCANNGTYWDSGGDTADSRGVPGARGLLVFQDHADTTQPAFTGSGQLSFSGALYFHSTGYADVLSLNGGTSSGTYILGQIVTDQVSLTGSGTIRLALNPQAVTNMAKVAILQ